MVEKKKHFKNDSTEIWIEDGVLFSRYAKNLKVNLDMAKTNVQARLDLSEGKDFPMLIYGANLRQLDSAAGKYLRTGDAIKGIKAGAFLADSQFDYLVMSFFVFVFNPNPPAKLFKDEAKALEWLQQFKG